MVLAVLAAAIVTTFASKVATAAMIIINTVVRAGPKIQPNSFYKLFFVVYTPPTSIRLLDVYMIYM